MSITGYIVLGSWLVSVGFFMWQHITSIRLEKVKAELAGLKALGRHQGERVEEIHEKNMKLKEELDETFTDTIASINASGLPNDPNPRTLRESIGELPEHILRKRLARAEAALATIYEWRKRVRES